MTNITSPELSSTIEHTVGPLPSNSSPQPPKGVERRSELSTFARGIVQLQRRLLDRTQSEVGRGGLSLLMQNALEICRGGAMVYLRRTADGRLSPHGQVRRRDFKTSETLNQEILGHCENVCRDNVLRCLDLVTAPQWKLAALPTRDAAGCGEVLALVLDSSAVLDPMVGPLLQSVALLMQLDAYRARSVEAEREAGDAFAIVEMLQRVVRGATVDDAAIRLAADLLKWLPASHCGVAVVDATHTRIGTLHVSGMTQSNANAPFYQALRRVVQETLRYRRAFVWRPPSTAQEQHRSESHPLESQRAGWHQRLAQVAHAGWVVSVPLLLPEVGSVEEAVGSTDSVGQRAPGDRSGMGIHPTAIGVLVLWGGGETPYEPRVLKGCEAVAGEIAELLEIVRERQMPIRYRVARRWLSVWGSHSRARWWVTACLLLGLVIHIPCPYAVPCQVSVRPMVRRYVVVPFDARLQKCFVRPGDIVTAEQPLAELDGQEMEIDLSQRFAEYTAESKRRDVAMAAQETAEAQQAQSQMERLQLEIKRLEKQLSELQVRSPISGVILQGELRETIGAPVNRGDTLFEIGPMDEMKGELFFSDEDYAYVATGRDARLFLNSDQLQSRRARVVHVDPAAQVRDGQNAFRGEVLMDNHDGILRPGMSGQARIYGPWRPWIWNVLRRPWLKLRSAWGA